MADDPPQTAPGPPDVEASTTGSQVLLRQRGTQRFVTCDRGDVLDAEPDPAERDSH